jgi:hypothetical protein
MTRIVQPNCRNPVPLTTELLHTPKKCPFRCGAVVQSQRGPVIAILHQYALHGHGKAIHSAGQLEHFKMDVDDRSFKASGGLQRMKSIDGYIFPNDIINGLPYTPTRAYTDSEWKALPHVIWTSDDNWDPSILDSKSVTRMTGTKELLTSKKA